MPRDGYMLQAMARTALDLLRKMQEERRVELRYDRELADLAAVFESENFRDLCQHTIDQRQS